MRSPGGAGRTKVKPIPESLRTLREPWLAEGVPTRLANHVRFASGLTEHDGHKAVVQYASGGSGTIIEEPVDDVTYAALDDLMGREYFEKVYEDDAREALQSFLASRGVELVVNSKHVPRGAYRLAREILDVLPAEHVGHESFRVLELGGWGHGAAKCSEYDGQSVRIFTFAVKGPRRNFAALLLHETGHANYARLEAADPPAHAELHRLHGEIVRHSPATEFRTDVDLMPFAVDYLLGAQSRVDETLSDSREFAAEVYLLYVVRGAGLKRRFGELAGGLREPWERIYEVCRGWFGGAEYE